MALSYLDNGTLKIGCYDGQPDGPFTGGSVGWLGLSGDPQNWVNNQDSGRQIQQSYYGDTPDYLQPGKTWSGNIWPWNPTQTQGRMIEFSNDGTTIYSRCQPYDWSSI
jgi:hypothetical protein